jgi:hypothetical protein
MNERIEQIAKQAGLQPFEDCGPGYVHKMEKFAELIIQECGVALNPMLRDMVSRGRAVDLIKQHFGVD